MLRLISFLVLAACLALGGCSYRPLYGTAGDGKGVAVLMSGVGVEQQKTRPGQIVRNNLVSVLGGGSGSRYLLRLVPVETSVQVSALSDQRLKRHRYNLKVAYELADVQSGKVVSSGASFSNVSYDTVEQPIADLRAAENARDRAGREVAEDIRTRLAAFFSTTQ